MSWFRCKFRQKADTTVSYHLTCGGSKAKATFETYVGEQLTDTQEFTIGSTNYWAGKIRVLGGSNGSWQVYVTANYVEYNGTKYTPTTGNPMINYGNGNARTTFIMIERDS